MNGKMDTRVSVVIPTLNNQGTIRQCLVSLQAQTLKPEEVLVVDGGSTDKTCALAREGGATVHETRLERSSARRLGAVMASGQFLLFVDADQTLSREVVSGCLKVASATGAEMIKVPEIDDCIGPWALCRALDQRLAASEDLSYPRFFNRDAYLRIGGHRVGLERFLEDRDLYLRSVTAGFHADWASGTISNHLGAINPLTLGRKGARAASDASGYFSYQLKPAMGLWNLMGPRIRNALQHESYKGIGGFALARFPFYELAVHGPRFLAATMGMMKSALGRSRPAGRVT